MCVCVSVCVCVCVCECVCVSVYACRSPSFFIIFMCLILCFDMFEILLYRKYNFLNRLGDIFVGS